MVKDTSIFPLAMRDASLRKRGATLLRDITLDLPAGGCTIVLGPNGAGKTSLLRMIHGMESPRSGSVTWAIEEERARQHRSFVFQTPTIMRRPLLDNVAYPLTVQGMPRQEARDRARHWIGKVGLSDVLDRQQSRKTPDNARFMSGGEKQKMALARALVAEPQLLILDEPTASLDGASTLEIETILQQAKHQGTTLVMATHDLGQARRCADRVIFLHKGHLLDVLPAQAFFSGSSSHEATAFLRGDLLT